MPVHFHCTYCRQLLGIGRRKAGTVVRCPKCTNQVVVPKPTRKNTAAPRLPAEDQPADADGAVLERSDFDQVFTQALKAQRRKARRAARAVAGADARGPSPEPAAAAPAPAPILEAPIAGSARLSPATVAWLSVASVVALALVFAAGVFVGLYLARTLPQARASLLSPAGHSPASC